MIFPPLQWDWCMLDIFPLPLQIHPPPCCPLLCPRLSGPLRQAPLSSGFHLGLADEKQQGSSENEWPLCLCPRFPPPLWRCHGPCLSTASPRFSSGAHSTQLSWLQVWQFPPLLILLAWGKRVLTSPWIL